MEMFGPKWRTIGGTPMTGEDDTVLAVRLEPMPTPIYATSAGSTVTDRMLVVVIAESNQRGKSAYAQNEN
jgi:hypothetical protein